MTANSTASVSAPAPAPAPAPLPVPSSFAVPTPRTPLNVSPTTPMEDSPLTDIEMRHYPEIPRSTPSPAASERVQFGPDGVRPLDLRYMNDMDGDLYRPDAPEIRWTSRVHSRGPVLLAEDGKTNLLQHVSFSSRDMSDLGLIAPWSRI